MRKFGLTAGAAAALALPAPAWADTVCEWIDFAQKIETAARIPRTGEHDHAQSQVALAMFEALNAIDRRYESYLGFPRSDPKASKEVAATTAAYRVLLTHFPSQKTVLEESYSVATDGVADEQARESGRRIGEAAARAALKAGLIDPAAVQVHYRPVTQTGAWVPTELPVFPPYRVTFKPWVLDRPDAVRPGPPPAVTSERFARDQDEVQRLGAKDSKERTPHQTLMARYRITPDMMPALRLVADQNGRRAVDNARMFALLLMISDDIDIAMADVKLHYNYWRPITAIRNADSDGNPATVHDPAWEPLIATPNHPEYPCGHCMYAGAIAELMSSLDGPTPRWGVRVASRSIPNAAVQILPNWDQWAEEVNFSRILGGVHYRFSNEVGEDIGRKITRLALAKVMRPLPTSRK